MRNVTWGAAVALLLGSVGCTSGTPAYLPSEDESPEAAIPVVATTAEASPPVVTVRGLDGEPKPRASAETIAPDEAIMATMECEPLSTDLLSKMRFEFGAPTRSVQVEVGEGLTPGEVWWVVVLDSPADDSYSWGIRRFLTNAPGGGGAWDWLAIQPRDPWANVLWDAQRLTRAQAALVKAERCLEG